MINNSLPHANTFLKWYFVLDAEPGITQEALDMLKSKCENSEKIICFLVFDEIAIREKVDYVGGKYYGFINFSSEANNVCAVANKALVFMLVCVNEAWKVPVAYFFIDSVKSDQKAELLTQVYTAITAGGISICNITFDGCPTNFTDCNLLGSNMTNVNNLQTRLHLSSDVFAFPDSPHITYYIS